MTREFLLEAIGLLDDDLIAQADRPPLRRGIPWRSIAGLCACLALILCLGRAAVENLAGGNSSSGPAASTSAGMGSGTGGGAEPSAGESSGGTSPSEGHLTIFVEGTLYASTGEVLSGEVAESAILGKTTYTDALPQEEGQANFAPEGTWYARTTDGIVVLVDGEWVRFAPVSTEHEGQP